MISKASARGPSLWKSAGTQTKEDVRTGFDEISANNSRGHGNVVGTLANGDEMNVRTNSLMS
jgi:hypothetical protein